MLFSHRLKDFGDPDRIQCGGRDDSSSKVAIRVREATQLGTYAPKLAGNLGKVLLSMFAPSAWGRHDGYSAEGSQFPERTSLAGKTLEWAGRSYFWNHRFAYNSRTRGDTHLDHDQPQECLHRTWTDDHPFGDLLVFQPF